MAEKQPELFPPLHLLLGHSFFLPSLLHLLPSKFSVSSKPEEFHSIPLLSFSLLGSLSLCDPKSPYSPCLTIPRNSANTDSPKLPLGPNFPWYLGFSLSHPGWMVWGCKRSQKRCRDVGFDHDEFLGKHQQHRTQSWAGVWDHHLSVGRSLTPHPGQGPSLWGLGLLYSSEIGFGCREQEEAGIVYKGWWPHWSQVAEFSPALEAAVLETGSCCKVPPWAC